MLRNLVWMLAVAGISLSPARPAAAVGMNTISIQAVHNDPPASGFYNQQVYEAAFGGNVFRLDFNFVSFAPVSLTVTPTGETAFYDLISIDIVGMNGRAHTLPFASTTQDLNIWRSFPVGGLADSALAVSHPGADISPISVFALDDTTAHISNFLFGFLTVPIATSLPTVSLAAFNYLDNVPTPFAQRFSFTANTFFLPDGTVVDFNTNLRDVILEDFTVLSNPAAVPLPAMLPASIVALLGVSFFAGRRRSPVPPGRQKTRRSGTMRAESRGGSAGALANC